MLDLIRYISVEREACSSFITKTEVFIWSTWYVLTCFHRTRSTMIQTWHGLKLLQYIASYHKFRYHHRLFITIKHQRQHFSAGAVALLWIAVARKVTRSTPWPKPLVATCGASPTGAWLYDHRGDGEDDNGATSGYESWVISLVTTT